MTVDERGYVPPEGGYGWVVVVACVVVNSCIMPLTQWFGIIYNNKVNEMNISATQISFLLHLNNAIMCSLGLISGPLLKQYNFRQITLAGCLFACSGIFLTAFFDSYYGLIFSIGILVGVGQGILLPGTYIAVNSYFKKRLTLAVTLQVTGVGLVPIVMPQLCIYLLEQFGTKGTVLILGGIALHAVPAAILMRPIKPKKKKLKMTAQGKKQTEESDQFLPENLNGNAIYKETTTPIQSKKADVLKDAMKAFNFNLLQDKGFVVILLGMSISFASELNIVLMMSFILKELNMDLPEIGNAASVQSTADILGRLFIPLLLQKTKSSAKFGYCLALLGSSLGRTTLAFFHGGNYIIFASMVVLGLSKGMKAVFQSLVIPKYVQFSQLAAATGLNMVSNGFFSLAIGPIIGLTHDLTGTYTSTLHAASFLSVFCVSMWTIQHLLNKNNNTDEEDMERANNKTVGETKNGDV